MSKWVEDGGGPIDYGDAQGKPHNARPKTRPSYNTRMRKKRRHAHKLSHGGKMRASGVNRVKGF